MTLSSSLESSFIPLFGIWTLLQDALTPFMAKRTVKKMNAKKNARLIAWCPSCYSQMNVIMSNGCLTEFNKDFLVEVIHW